MNPIDDDYIGECANYVRYTEVDKSLCEDAPFEEMLRQENRDCRRENLLRQERRNVSLRARGDNHYRKVHSASIKARKGWR